MRIYVVRERLTNEPQGTFTDIYSARRYEQSMTTLFPQLRLNITEDEEDEFDATQQ